MQSQTLSVKSALTRAFFCSAVFLASTSALPTVESIDSTDANDHNALTFDYVIVGGGIGGLVMANRLTENPNISVAVIEAGDFAEKSTGNLTQVPGYNLVFDTGNLSTTPYPVDWGFITTPQAGLKNAQMRYPRGKAWGGSSNLNAMAWAYSTKGAFQLWADRVGDRSWNFDGVDKYYQKAINIQPLASQRAANATPLYNGADLTTGSPMQVRYPPYSYSWTSWLAEALDNIGMKKTASFINGNLSGSAYQFNALNHTTSHRVSAAEAYLRPFLQRSNLHLYGNTFAQKVLFNNVTATGVLVNPVNKTNTYTLTAKREVIVTCGVFQSPQLLQVSGVGDKTLLQKYGIKVVADRPGVGQNMHDQGFFGITYQISIPVPVTQGGSPQAVAAAAQFNKDGTGPLSNPLGEYDGYEQIPADLRANLSQTTLSTLAEYPSDWPQIEYVTLPAFLGNGRTTPAPTDGKFYATIAAVLQTPESHGNVSISSAKMSDPPLINPSFLTDQRDVEVSRAMFRRLRQIWAQDVFHKNNITIGAEYFPGAAVQTDAQIDDFLHGNVQSIYHASATNKMGLANDTKAVVDFQGRVFGTKALRVADISAFPFLPPGTAPQAAVYVLAEKISDYVKAAQTGG